MMNQLVKIKKNDIFTDSIVIANGTENAHESVITLIRKYEDDFRELGSIEYSDYLKSNKLKTKGTKIDLNEPQASYLITLLRNNDIVRRFKLELVKEFFRMRQFILERQTAEWQQSRLIGKQIRKDETDVILEKLIPLAESQGSNNAGKLYMVYSKLVNNTLGIEAGRRDNLPLAYVDAIRFLERAISNIISIEAGKGTYYKEIYQICKAKCLIIKELSFLPDLEKSGRRLISTAS